MKEIIGPLSKQCYETQITSCFLINSYTIEQTQAPYTPLEADELSRSNQGMVS